MDKNQCHQPGNLVFRLSQELALQLIEHMENIRDDESLTIPKNISARDLELKTKKQINDFNQLRSCTWKC